MLLGPLKSLVLHLLVNLVAAGQLTTRSSFFRDGLGRNKMCYSRRKPTSPTPISTWHWQVGVMWVKQRHKPSPSHQHFYRWYMVVWLPVPVMVYGIVLPTLYQPIYCIGDTHHPCCLETPYFLGSLFQCKVCSSTGSTLISEFDEHGDESKLIIYIHIYIYTILYIYIYTY